MSDKKAKANSNKPPAGKGAKPSPVKNKQKTQITPPPQNDQEKEDLLKARFLKAYSTSNRNLSKSCKAAGVSRSKVYKVWIKDKVFLDAMKEVEESFMDLAKSKAWAIIKAIDPKKPGREAITVLLKMIDKDKSDNPAEKGKLEEIAAMLNPHGFK